MEGMFDGCGQLKKLKGIEKFNTKGVKNMKDMFRACSELKELDLSNFNTSKVTNMKRMFYFCEKIKKIK